MRTIGFGGLVLAILLSGCAGASSPFAAPEPAARELNMTGRWILTAPNAPSCGINLAAAPGAQQGAVSPEGGCPANFFTGRRWTFADGTLTITDEESQPLAQFKFSIDHFAGQSTGGIPLTLTR
jgi:hypothetical protein